MCFKYFIVCQNWLYSYSRQVLCKHYNLTLSNSGLSSVGWMTQLLLVVFVASANLFITTAELRHLISAESKLTGFYSFLSELLIYLLRCRWRMQIMCQSTDLSSAVCSFFSLPSNFVRGHDSTVWDIVWVAPHAHRSLWAKPQSLQQAPQCPWFVLKRFGVHHRFFGRSNSQCSNNILL